MQPGVQPNGLFWTIQIPRSSFMAKANWARLSLRDFPLVESFEFGGPHTVPATVSIDLEWRSASGRKARGKGKDVPPEAPEAFLGQFADASCTGTVSGKRMGFAFKSGPLDATGFYASMGHERNGAWLS